MDWTLVGVNAITALTSVVVMVGVWALKLAWDKIPASVVLFVTPVLGIAVNFGLSYLASHPPQSVLVAAAAGLFATVLREWWSTLATKGLSGPVSVTKLSL
jgi:hypothetical protein